MESSTASYSKMTVKNIIGLIAPNTWSASILPVFAACGFCYATTGAVSLSLTCTLLVICILLQSSVNVLNDYFDFIKGTDSIADNLECSDAVLLYDNVNPKDALHLSIVLIVLAFVLGVYPILWAGWAPLLIAAIGASIVFFYSGGKSPISYLPLGEAVSGFAMGSLMCFACYTVLTRTLNPIIFVWSIPFFIGISLIMQVNNTCDIEKDSIANRRTLAVLIGRVNSVKAFRLLIIIWIASIIIISLIWFRNGLFVLPFMILAIIPICKGLFSNPLLPETRIAAMNSICIANIAFGCFYIAAVFASKVILIM